MQDDLPSQFDLTGKTALVTGASSGFGWHFSQVLAAAGARIVAGARRIERLEALCREIGAGDGKAHPVMLDVTDAKSIGNAFDVAEATFGAVDILVNNAGISRSGLLLNLQEEDWDAVLNTNLKAVWRVGSEAASRMRSSSRAGSIINVASVLAFGTGKGLGSYMAAKAGVVQLTRAMALEWASADIRVNALAPGYFPTEISGDFFSTAQGQEMIGRIPRRRVGEVNELGGPLLLLASGASSYMTGSVVTVDGGHLCRTL